MPTVTLPPDLPSRMRHLRRDDVGRPVPWFVPDVDGKPDFRLMDGQRLVDAIRQQLCWVCGQRLNRARGSNAPRGTFLAGPMCVVNRTSAEPPNHADCAEWSAKACPFLTKPAKERRSTNLPEGVDLTESAGIAILRNPGVSALIESTKWSYYRTDGIEGAGDGILFNFTRIDNVHWLAEGKPAGIGQVLDSIETGLPALVEMAETEDGAMRALAFKMRDALRWVGSFDATEYPLVERVLSELP